MVAEPHLVFGDGDGSWTLGYVQLFLIDDLMDFLRMVVEI